MEALIILIVFLVFFFLEYSWETILAVLNNRHVKRNAGRIPAFLVSYIDPETGIKAARYTHQRQKFSLVSSAASSVFVLFVVLFGLLGVLDRALGRLNLDLYLHGLAYIAAVSLIFSVFSLPFSVYGQFVIEERFGFNKMTPGLFFKDRIKALVISCVIGIPLLLALFFFMETLGAWWWIVGFGFFTLVQVILSLIYPSLIAPLFNKFTPLAEGSLKEKITRLLDSLDYKTKGIFVMDGSKRSRHSNAYFTGLGKTKRIVLFDTLINTLEEDEIVSVFAHELGHEKLGHVWKNLIIGIIGSALGFFILSLLLPWPAFYQAFGFAKPGYHALLVLISLASGPFTFFLRPVFSVFSRKHEYAADAFAKKALGGDPKPLGQSLIKLSKDNLTNLYPHPLYSFFYYSHPTLAERVDALEKN